MSEPKTELCGGEVERLRQKIVAEIMSLVRQQPKTLEKPSIEELEKILNSECADDVNIEADGTVSVRPTVTTVGVVADKVCAAVEATITSLFEENRRLREATAACKGEQEHFEKWASAAHYDMHQHPLHYLFLDPKTYAARQGWKAALAYVEATAALSTRKDQP